MKRFFSMMALLLLASAGGAMAQSSPTIIAIFPLKNLGGEAIHDSLGWQYTDSLIAYLNTKPNAGTVYTLIPLDTLREQFKIHHLVPGTPNYENDMWTLVRKMGATKLVWGTYHIKYEKADIQLRIYDAKTVMADTKNVAEKLRSPLSEALSTVEIGAEKILPGLK